MGGLGFREATLDDASFSADVHTEVFPERPTDPVVERYWWAQPDDTFVIRRWVVRRRLRAAARQTAPPRQALPHLRVAA